MLFDPLAGGRSTLPPGTSFADPRTGLPPGALPGLEPAGQFPGSRYAPGRQMLPPVWAAPPVVRAADGGWPMRSGQDGISSLFAGLACELHAAPAPERAERWTAFTHAWLGEGLDDGQHVPALAARADTATPEEWVTAFALDQLGRASVLQAAHGDRNAVVALRYALRCATAVADWVPDLRDVLKPPPVRHALALDAPADPGALDAATRGALVRLAGADGILLDWDDCILRTSDTGAARTALLSNWFAEHAPKAHAQYDETQMRSEMREMRRRHPHFEGRLGEVRLEAVRMLLIRAGEDPNRAVEACAHFYRARNATPLYPGSEPALIALHGAGYRFFGVTSGDAQLPLVDALTGTRLHGLHEGALSGALYHLRKPDAGYTHEVLRRLRCPADRAFLMGDSVDEDVGAAVRAGLRGAVLVRGTASPVPHLHEGFGIPVVLTPDVPTFARYLLASRS